MAIELQKNDRFMCFPLLQYICSLKYGRVTANCDAAMHLEDKHYQQFKKCISRRHHRTLCDDGGEKFEIVNQKMIVSHGQTHIKLSYLRNFYKPNLELKRKLTIIIHQFIFLNNYIFFGLVQRD